MGLILKRTQRAPLDSSESRGCNDRGLASGEEEENRKVIAIWTSLGKRSTPRKARFWLDREEGKRVSKAGDGGCRRCRVSRVSLRQGGIQNREFISKRGTDTEHQTGGTGRGDVEPKKSR